MKLPKFLSKGEEPIPPIIHGYFKRHYIASAAILSIGVVVCIIFRSITLLILPLIIALALSGMGYFKMLDISKNGYKIIEGMCERVEIQFDPAKTLNYVDPLSPVGVGKNSKKNTPTSYLIRGSDITNDPDNIKIYRIPYVASAAAVEEGNNLRIYLSSKSGEFERNGIVLVDGVLACELI